MTTSATQLLLQNISKYNLNPSSIQQDILNVLELGLAGDDIVDCTSPFIFLMEAAATGIAAAISESQSVTRQLYPLLAMQQSELYHHMSDLDYIGIFATGATSTIKVMIPYNSLQLAALYLNGSTNVKTVVFPRDTQISVNGIDLGICYPIEINLLAYNVIQVMYDATIANPLMPLTTNVLKNELITYQGLEYLQVEIPVIQYTNNTSIFALNDTVAFSQSINFSDSFYYARAYINTGTGPWIEILTTHTYMVYDISRPTLKLEVDGNILTVSLPDIYQSLQTAGTSIRVDIFSTKGAMSVDLSQIPNANFSAKWIDFDTRNINPGVAPLNSINDMIFFSTALLSGGSNGATLEQLRDRTIYHVNSTKAPVRLSDLDIGLSMYGYVTEKLIDSITDRVFIASKNLPTRNINGLLTIPLATNANVRFKITDGDIGGLYRKSILTQSIQRATITPATIYSFTNGNVSILSDSELDHLATLNPTDLCTMLNSGLYMYSPFHYVIDYTNPTLTARPYYLSAPKINGKTFEASNTVRNYNINTINTSISLQGDSYVLILVASIPTGITGVHCQLSFVDKNSGTSVYIDGVENLMANLATFTFTLTTNFDINQLDEIELLNMYNVLDVTAPMFVGIESTFNVFYLVTGDHTGLETKFDKMYHANKNQPAVIGATHETITISFGQYLHGLYCPARDILVTGEYHTYPENVYATYTSIVYKSGPQGNIWIKNPDNTIHFVIDHNIGDFILDSEGHQIILHKAGDYMLDVNGELMPVVNYSNSIERQIGITMFDAKYNYATSFATAAYNKAIPDNIIAYITNELAPAAKLLNERTELYYKPMGTPGILDVLIGNGLTAQVIGILNIKITYYLSQEGINSADILNKISTLTRTIISSHITKSTISVAALTSDLLLANPEQVIGFTIDSFLPNNTSVVTLVNTGNSFVIGEELYLLPDGTLEIKDMVDIVFNSSL